MRVYNLQQPISSSIFNFKKVAFNRDVDQFSADSSSIAYSCEYSPFKDFYHGHRLTDDLRIVEDNKLRKIFLKGP